MKTSTLAVRLLLFAGILALPALRASAQDAAAPAAGTLPFPNAGFESGSDGWNISKEDVAASLDQISAEAAHSGKAGLRVKQADGGPGSWIQSDKITVEPGKRYRITYWARCVEDSGVGLWMQAFDADRKPIKPENAQAYVSLVPPTAKEWTQFSFDIMIPPNGASLAIAVHCFSKRATLADFDDFSVVLNP